MKNLRVGLIALMVSFSGILLAQDLTPPKQGAVIRMQEYSHDLSFGEEFTANIWLVKSKSFRKAKFGGLAVYAPKGIEATIEAEGDHYIMKLKVSKEVTPAKYTLMIEGEGKNAYRVRSSTFALTVNNSQLVVEKD